jgi:hypothetical protein
LQIGIVSDISARMHSPALVCHEALVFQQV